MPPAGRPRLSVALGPFQVQGQDGFVSLRWRPPHAGACRSSRSATFATGRCPPTLMVVNRISRPTTAAWATNGERRFRPRGIRPRPTRPSRSPDRWWINWIALRHQTGCCRTGEHRLSEFCHRVCGAGFSPAAVTEAAKAFLRRCHCSTRPERPGNRRQASRLAGAEVAAVPVLGIGSRPIRTTTMWPHGCRSGFGIRCPIGTAGAAAEVRLQTPDKVAAQARRMLPDPRARAKLRYFLHHWLKVDRG